MSSESSQISEAERQLIADNEYFANRRIPTVEEYQRQADAINVARGLPPLYSQSTSVAGVGPTLNSAGNISIGSIYQDVGGAATDAFNAIAGGLINGASGIVAGVADVIGGIADIPNQIFGKFAKQPSSPKYGMSERGTTTQGAGTSTSVKQDIAKNTAIPDKLSYPLNQSSRFKFAIQISDYVKPDPLSRPLKNIKADIFLPIPANLAERYGVDVQEVNLGALTDKIASGISAVTNGNKSVEQQLDAVLAYGEENAGTIAKQVGFAAGLAAVKTAGQAAGIDAEAIVSTTIGKAINPGAAVMFKGVRMRPDHTFQWRLTPRNSVEAEQIKKIIGKLRRSMLPETTDTRFGMVFNYPKVFNIEILPADNPMFPKYKSCFLESMEVNYAPTGLSFHGDNVPTEIDLKLTFQELVIFTAGDFDPNTGEYVKEGHTPAPVEPLKTDKTYGDNTVKLRQEAVDAVNPDTPPTDPSRKIGDVRISHDAEFASLDAKMRARARARAQNLPK